LKDADILTMVISSHRNIKHSAK